MKIGIFGDSFAEKAFQPSNKSVIWYNFLEHEYGHTVDCFGESGSSILFSAELIKQHAINYNLVIWCLTTPGRFSLPHNNPNMQDHFYHVHSANTKCLSSDIEIITKHQVCVDYLKYIFDWKSENLISKALVLYIQQQCPNLLIIPCFPPPLDAKFNLYNLSEWEANFYFPGKSISEIYKSYQDCRPGHITQENQKILAQLINDNLTPGIFQNSYDNFVKPITPLEETFKLR